MAEQKSKTLHELNMEAREIDRSIRSTETQAIDAMKGAAMRILGGKEFRRERKNLRPEDGDVKAN